MPGDYEEDIFTNPILPASSSAPADDEGTHPLTNDDFRKLLVTPASKSSSTGERGSKHASGQSSRSKKDSHGRPTKEKKQDAEGDEEDGPDDGTSSHRRKRKNFYAKMRKAEEQRQAELAEKYRDRAAERREGKMVEYREDGVGSTTANYRAVAPDIDASNVAGERRKQLIQESKFLGGDMEHTHLVKGLDFALLQKVRSEISNKEKEEMEMEDIVTNTVVKERKETTRKERKELSEIDCHTNIGKSVLRALFYDKPPERNELFLPGRMAYVVDLEDDYTESDIPTTLIRSKADCPTMESQTTLTTNDIVINKLTQILSYLRQGMRAKKTKKKDKGKLGLHHSLKLPEADSSIFGEVGDYVPNLIRSKDSRREKMKSYFDEPSQGKDKQKTDTWPSEIYEEGHRPSRDKYRNPDPAPPPPEPVNSQPPRDRYRNPDPAVTMTAEPDMAVAGQPRSRKKKLMSNHDETYAECYPGFDHMIDSDDEVDYSKMDLGNKKGPVGRWDFDTDEQYSDYMSHREAMPKAAFQFGIKMHEGRKTRRAGPKDEKAKLDREWQKITQIIAKRKATGQEGVVSDRKYARY